MRNIIFTLLVFNFTLRLLSQTSKLVVSVDEKVETLYAVAYLDKYFLINKHDNLHKQKLTRAFPNPKSYKAVVLFDSLCKTSGFEGYKIVDWVLQFDSFPGLNTIRKVAAPYPFAANENLLSEFKKELITFYNEPLLKKYLDDTRELNSQVIKRVTSSKTIRQLPGYLENYYGKKLGSYNLIISPFLHTGGFNCEMVSASGSKDVFAVLGPNGEIDFLPYFDKDYIETDMILHEFGHSFVNPVTDKYVNEIEKLKEKYYTKNLQQTAESNGYNEWRYVFNELLLRATTIKITEKYFGKEKARECLEEEIAEGFGLVETFVNLLSEYDLNRAKYRSFDDFCPVLIKRMQ